MSELTSNEIFWMFFPMAFIISNIFGWCKFVDWYYERQLSKDGVQ